MILFMFQYFHKKVLHNLSYYDVMGIRGSIIQENRNYCWK
jgi:hypothetical protein